MQNSVCQTRFCGEWIPCISPSKTFVWKTQRYSCVVNYGVHTYPCPVMPNLNTCQQKLSSSTCFKQDTIWVADRSCLTWKKNLTTASNNLGEHLVANRLTLLASVMVGGNLEVGQNFCSTKIFLLMAEKHILLNICLPSAKSSISVILSLSRCVSALWVSDRSCLTWKKNLI